MPMPLTGLHHSFFKTFEWLKDLHKYVRLDFLLMNSVDLMNWNRSDEDFFDGGDDDGDDGDDDEGLTHDMLNVNPTCSPPPPPLRCIHHLYHPPLHHHHQCSIIDVNGRECSSSSSTFDHCLLFQSPRKKRRRRRRRRKVIKYVPDCWLASGLAWFSRNKNGKHLLHLLFQKKEKEKEKRLSLINMCTHHATATKKTKKNETRAQAGLELCFKIRTMETDP